MNFGLPLLAMLSYSVTAYGGNAFEEKVNALCKGDQACIDRQADFISFEFELMMFDSKLISSNSGEKKKSILAELKAIGNKYESLCVNNHAGGCKLLGDVHNILQENGANTRDNALKAANYYFKGCELGSLNACSVMGNVLFQDKNYKNAQAFLVKACNFDIKNPPSYEEPFKACFRLGQMHGDGIVFNKNMNSAMTFFKKACNKGSGYPQSCRTVGSIYRSGESVPKDYQKAIEYYQYECISFSDLSSFRIAFDFEDFSNQSSSCSMLSGMYNAGWGVDKDPYMASYFAKRSKQKIIPDSQAVKLFESSCLDNHALGCLNAGTVYTSPKNDVKFLPQKGFSYYEKGCELGNAESCYLVGLSYWYGEGVSKSSNRALKALNKSCQFGYGDACKDYQSIEKTGGLE